MESINNPGSEWVWGWRMVIPDQHLKIHPEIIEASSQEDARRIPSSLWDSHLSLNHLSRATSFGGLCGWACSKTDDKIYLCQAPCSLRKGIPSWAPPSAFQLITQFETSLSELSHSLCDHVWSRFPLFPFLYLLFLSLPHSLTMEGWLSCHGNPLPPPLLCSSTNFLHFNNITIYSAQSLVPSTAALQGTFLSDQNTND